MKKFLTLILITIVGITLWSCSDRDEDQLISATQLPSAAQNFLKKYFPTQSVLQVEKETKYVAAEYSVLLSNGFEIEFDVIGDWIDVDAPDNVVLPAGIVPSPIADYIAQNYSQTGVNEITRISYGYEVELTSGLELRFSPQGKLLMIERSL